MLMRILWLIALLSAPIFGQPTARETMLIELARQKVEKVRASVESGVLPLVELVQAERAYANAKDDEYLRKTLYGDNLTPAASQEMMALTARRITEHKEQVETIRKLVEQQKLPANELEAEEDALVRAEKEHDWALTRAGTAKEMTEYRAAAAERRVKIGVKCSIAYKSTADKKVKDLTVKEEQLVRACQNLNLYHP